MSFKKRLAALGLVMVLTASLSACGNDNAGDSNAAGGATTDSSLTPTEIVNNASEKMGTAKSLDAVMKMEMAMSAQGQAMNISSTLDMSCFNDPMKLRADVNMDMGEMGSMDMQIYAQEADGSYTLYVNDGTTWAAQAAQEADLAGYDAASSFNLYLDGAVDFKADGTEDLNGSKADKFTGVIRGDALKQVLQSAGSSMSSLQSLMGDDANMDEVINTLGDLPITVWIDQASGYPVRFNLDMTEMMSTLMKDAMAASGDDSASIDKVTMEMTCSNFDAATDFTIPEEALAAA